MSFNEIIATINSDINKPLNQKIDEIKSNIGKEFDDTEKKLKQYIDKFKKTNIKNIQKGMYQVTCSGSNTVPISNVNPDKCIAIIKGYGQDVITKNSAGQAYGETIGGAPTLSIISQNSISFYLPTPHQEVSNFSVKISWQLIEFY